MKKHLLFLFTALLPLVASAHDFEVDGIYYNITSKADKTANVTCKGNYYDSYRNEYSGSITIPATVTHNGVAYSVTSIGYSAFEYCSSLTAITLPESVTSIGEGAFRNCSSLAAINIPEGVKSIGNQAFSCCSSLTSITIPESVTSIGERAFYGCSSLTAITFPEGVTSIGDGAFNNCSSLKSINIPASVTSMGYGVFSQCLSLTDITIPEGVTSIGERAFACCNSLTDITIPASVTSIGDGAFSQCLSLTSITLPEGVTSIGEMTFYQCHSLTAINIPESVTSIGEDAFYQCRSLTAITIPEGVTSIGDDAFRGCSSLTAITLPEGVTSIRDYAFSGCSSLTSITIPEGVTSIGSYAFSGCSSLTAITFPEGVTSIGEWAFNGCSSLTAITLPEGVTSIGGGAFSGCSSLTDIVVAEGNQTYDSRGGCNAIIETSTNTLLQGCSSTIIPESVTSMGEYAFAHCSSLTSITLPEGVTSIGEGAFSNCSSLTSITLPEGVTSIGSSAFYGCSSLTSITFPENSQLTSIGERAFSGCSSLTAITIPEGVTSIGDHAFRDCSSLTAINIPENSKLTSIGEYAFCDCSNLTAITIPEGVTSIGDHAFYYCSSLTAINIPEGVTSIGDWTFFCCSSLYKVINYSDLIIQKGSTNNGLVAYYAKVVYQGGELTTVGDFQFYTSDGIHSLVNYIGNDTEIGLPDSYNGENYKIGGWAFSGCSSLITIMLPKSVSSIGYGAFANCSELTDVYCYAEMVPSTETNAFDGSYIEYVTLHVPTSALNSYKGTAPWSSFGTIVSLDAAITRITLSASSATLTAGESLTLTITTTPEDADRNLISWSSNNPSIATVDNAGKVTAIAPGTATITANANDGSGVSAQCEVTVTPASYVITYLIDGEVFLTDTLTRGSAISLPDVPTKEGYTFSGWSEVPETMPAEDVNISGTFIINKYLVTFKIGDEVIAADSLEYGATIVAPEAPEKEGHTFNGWGEVAENVPANDVTYEGSYSVNSYLLTIAIDGEIVESDSIAYGTTITLPEAPTKEGYTFSGWSEVPETMPAEDVTVSGTFIINKYLVTFKIGDEVIAADSLEYGATIVAPEAPEKEGHTFNGWGEVAENVPANDVTYEGSYSVNSYLLTIAIDGEMVESDSIAYGTTITLPEAPTKEGYTFSGWSEVPETMPANDVTISGTYTVNNYTVTFKIGDEVIFSESMAYGTAIVAPEAPAKEGHTFDGWGEVAATVPASDVTYEGTYTVNVYNVYYYVGDELVHTAEVAYGETIPEYVYEPTTEGDEFLGWIGDTYETMPAHDVTYTANIESGINQITIDNGQLNIYDLMGRKVTDTENLTGGIYIIDGKKVIIK